MAHQAQHVEWQLWTTMFRYEDTIGQNQMIPRTDFHPLLARCSGLAPNGTPRGQPSYRVAGCTL